MKEQHDLFDIKIDEGGRKSLKSVFRISRLVFWMVAIVEVAALFYTIRNYLRYKNTGSSFGDTSYYYWGLRIYTGYVIVYSLLALLQFFYFFSFSQQAKRNIELNNALAFNNSFKWLYKSLLVFLALTVLNILYFLSLILFEPPAGN